jgi:hypothetical protein
MRQHGHLVNTPFKIGIDQAIWFQSRTAYIRPKPTPQRHQRFKEYPHNRSQPFNRAITGNMSSVTFFLILRDSFKKPVSLNILSLAGEKIKNHIFHNICPEIKTFLIRTDMAIVFFV